MKVRTDKATLDRPGVEVQHEGGAYGDGEEPLRVGPARHAFDGDLHRDSCPRPHIRSKASSGTRLVASLDMQFQKEKICDKKSRKSG